MEIVIESKRFVFSSLISSVSFWVVEIGSRNRQTVDLKLHEAIWLISPLRLIYAEGFFDGRWLNRYFKGRSFSISCKINRGRPFCVV